MTWQITLDELFRDTFEPDKFEKRSQGLIEWFCPICGDLVGISSDGTVHPEGELLRREECHNGHKIDWKGENNANG